jgi:hypothetical protein
VADSEAVRSRRKRLHAAGDHSMCRRCAAVRGDDVASRVTALPSPPAASAVRLDPVAEMRLLAAELHDAYRADTSNGVLARELRMTLAELMPKGKRDADDGLAGLFGALQA